MHVIRKLTDDIYSVGADDRRLADFENLFPLDRGVSYNSFLIMDDKTVLMDGADEAVGKVFEENLEFLLQGRPLDYIVIQHMEPDHAACIGELALRYPEMQMYGSVQAGNMLRQFFNMDFGDRIHAIKEGDTLETANHCLNFVAAPMVHWPEVMMTFDSKSQIFFTADGFGTFGALNGHLFADEVNYDRDWLDDSRRYYANIVGKYGAQVQAVMKKAAKLPIKTIAPLHGPIWRENLDYILGKYDLWSRYEPEDKDAVVILYGSMYGNTANTVNSLCARLVEAGVKNVMAYDLSILSLSHAISEIWRAGTIVLACPTYNGGIYPPMEHLICDMKALNVQNRRIALIENGTWAPAAGRQMRTALEGLKNITFLENTVTIRSVLKEESSDKLDALVEEIKAGL